MTTHYTDRFHKKLKETQARAREPTKLELKIEVGDSIKLWRENAYKKVIETTDRKVRVSETEFYWTTEIQKVIMRRKIEGKDYIIEYEHGGRDGRI